jgi:hypothetical protein
VNDADILAAVEAKRDAAFAAHRFVHEHTELSREEHECVWGVKTRFALRDVKICGRKLEFRASRSQSFGTRPGITRFQDRTESLGTLEVALTALLRLGESARCAQRVEGVLEVPPALVAEGDACHWRTNSPQSPTHGIDWCGVQAVHLRSIGPTAATGEGVRLSEVPARFRCK